MDLEANFQKVKGEDSNPDKDSNKGTSGDNKGTSGDKAVQTGDKAGSPVVPIAGLMLAAGAAVAALRKKED